MADPRQTRRYQFGVFEVDSVAGELRRQGVRIKLNVQPFQVLLMLLERPGQTLTREEISRELWPEGTFVDFEHGVNSAVNRIREALGDPARNPRFIETLARRGYRFVAPVQEMVEVQESQTVVPPLPHTQGPNVTSDEPRRTFGDGFLASPHELPKTSSRDGADPLPRFCSLCMSPSMLVRSRILAESRGYSLRAGSID